MTDRLRLLHRVAFGVTATVLLVDALVLAAGVLSGRQALTLFLAVELPLTLVFAIAVVASVAVRVRAGRTLRAAAGDVAAESPVRPFVRGELVALRAVVTWFRGRTTGVEPGALVLTAHRGRLAMPLAFVAVTAVEIVVLHILIPWPWLKTALLVLSIWSILALLGWHAVGRTNPHFLTARRLVVRHLGVVVATVERDDVVAVQRRRSFAVTSPTIDDGVLHLPNPDGTVVDVVLREPVEAELPALLRSRRRRGPVAKMSLHLDDPEALVDEFAARDAVA